MPASLVILHIPKEFRALEKEALQEFQAANLRHFVWRTCLRTLIFSVSDQKLQPKLTFPVGEKRGDTEGVGIYRGVAAYRYLLEIVSGLHSPLLGETEVLGQFKGFLQSIADPKDIAAKRMVRMGQILLQDAKLVRTRFLRGLGPRTYGSVIRKFLSEDDNVSFFGAGRLTADILPWLNPESRTITCYVRNIQGSRKRLQELGVDSSEIRLRDLSSWDAPIQNRDNGVLLIAANIDTTTLKALLENSSELPGKIIDLREESQSKPLHMEGTTIIGLEEFFKRFAEADREADVVRTAASEFIRKRAQFRGEKIEHRPFGWDDICA